MTPAERLILNSATVTGVLAAVSVALLPSEVPPTGRTPLHAATFWAAVVTWVACIVFVLTLLAMLARRKWK